MITKTSRVIKGFVKPYFVRYVNTTTTSTTPTNPPTHPPTHPPAAHLPPHSTIPHPPPLPPPKKTSAKPVAPPHPSTAHPTVTSTHPASSVPSSHHTTTSTHSTHPPASSSAPSSHHTTTATHSTHPPASSSAPSSHPGAVTSTHPAPAAPVHSVDAVGKYRIDPDQKTWHKLAGNHANQPEFATSRDMWTQYEQHRPALTWSDVAKVNTHDRESINRLFLPQQKYPTKFELITADFHQLLGIEPWNESRFPATASTPARTVDFAEYKRIIQLAVHELGIPDPSDISAHNDTGGAQRTLFFKNDHLWAVTVKDGAEVYKVLFLQSETDKNKFIPFLIFPDAEQKKKAPKGQMSGHQWYTAFITRWEYEWAHLPQNWNNYFPKYWDTKGKAKTSTP